MCAAQRSCAGPGSRGLLCLTPLSEKAISLPGPSPRIRGHFRAFRVFFFLNKRIILFFLQSLALRARKLLEARHDITVNAASTHGKVDIRYLLLLIYLWTRADSSRVL